MTNGRRILILTSSHLCRNPRVLKEATTLGAAGYDVTVMTISTQIRFEHMDVALLRGLPFKRLTLDYSVENCSMRLANFFQRGSTWAARQLLSKTGVETSQTLGPARALLRFARSFAADLTIVHTEIPIWIAQYLIRDGRRVAVDVEDWYSEDLLHKDRRSRPLSLLRAAERFALSHAVYSSATSGSMATALSSAYRCPIPIVLRNVFPLQPVSRVDLPVGNEPPRFIWFSQTIGPGRGLELFLAAWQRTHHASTIYLLGDERPGYCDYLREMLPASRRGDFHYLPLVSPNELPDTLTRFEIGLALEPKWPLNRDVTISNKIFQYLNAGLAVVATDTAGQREVMKEAPGAGLLVKAGETTLLAAELDRLITDRSRMRAMQESARSAAKNIFCWNLESARLLEVVAEALARP